MLCPRTASSSAIDAASLISRHKRGMDLTNLRENGNAALRKKLILILQILNLKIDLFYLNSCITCEALGYILLEIMEVS